MQAGGYPVTAASWNGWGDPSRRPGLDEATIRFLWRELGVAPGPPHSPAALSDVELPASALDQDVRERLAAVAEVTDDRAARIAHARGKAYRDLVRIRAGDAGNAPDAVVTPSGPAEVGEVLRICSDADVAVVPFGGGTSVVGGVEPLRGRFGAVVALDLARLDRLIAVDPVSRTATLQPGLTTPAADAALAEHGFTLGHLPQSYEFATIGGYLATRSAGQASTGFGRSDDLVLGLKLATPVGELSLGRTPKSAAGPDLRQLVLGSEGAFGVITEATLRVRPLPEHRRYEGWFFPSFLDGVAALRRLVQDGAAPDVCRLSDEDETAATLAMAGKDTGLAAAYLRLRRRRALVIVGWECQRDVVATRRALAARRLKAAGGLAVGESVGRSWEKQRFAAPYLRDDLLDAGVLVETLETAATWSRLPYVHEGVRTALAASLERPRIGCHVSHLYPAGASLYFTVLVPAQTDDADELVARWDAAKQAATDALLAAGGTLTHHHAIGADHARWLPREIGELGVDVLRTVKQRLDPKGILNPGKLLA